jgi:hypothetical protein
MYLTVRGIANTDRLLHSLALAVPMKRHHASRHRGDMDVDLVGFVESRG